MVEFARHFTSIMRISLSVFLSLIILLNIILFILSVLQANTPNAAEAFPSSQTEHWGYNKQNSTCEDYPYVPVRFMYQSQQSLPQRYEYCSWKSRNTWWRSISMILLLIGAAVVLPILAKKSPASDSAAIWQDPKNVLRALLIPTGIMGINMFLLMCFDASAVNMSQQWCVDELQQPGENSNPVTCDYTPFIVTVIFDFLLFVFWGLVVLLIFFRQLKRFRPYQQFVGEEDSHEMLERSDDGWRKKGGKSWLDKHFKKAKDRVKGRK